jgi:hypothetical protein
MAGHTFTSSGRGMNTGYSGRLCMLLVTAQTYPGRRLIQESGMFAGVNTMARLTVTTLHRRMLGSCGNPTMAAKTQIVSSLGGKDLIVRALVTTIAAVAQRCMNHLA